MKFSNTASMAALAGLSLLIPAVHGTLMFDCGNDARFLTSTVMEYLSIATAASIEDDDPPYAQGQVNGAYRFTKNINNVNRTFLVQSTNIHPFYRFFEITSGHYECPLKEHYA
ncbi:CSEP0106 putative effector protein [Blumeria hordei DH14]|uniref:CSEP0106 putative effector protein n=1 Tax=Blumeria graminis f. sp. hordei (strain DH14) TaxID=546991 RepID=N1JNI3_BLUG1|nr:CSEP0106 putative effector protein [Blumeria hordei DH14]